MGCAELQSAAQEARKCSQKEPEMQEVPPKEHGASSLSRWTRAPTPPGVTGGRSTLVSESLPLPQTLGADRRDPEPADVRVSLGGGARLHLQRRL